VLNWLYQMEHLFAIHETPIEDRLDFCVFFLKDEALVWWQWLQKQKGGDVTWPELCEEMRLQFRPDELDDPMTVLANLKQMGSVHDYHKAFIKLAYLVDDTKKNLISLFTWTERRYEAEGEA